MLQCTEMIADVSADTKLRYFNPFWNARANTEGGQFCHLQNGSKIN